MAQVLVILSTESETESYEDTLNLVHGELSLLIPSHLTSTNLSQDQSPSLEIWILNAWINCSAIQPSWMIAEGTEDNQHLKVLKDSRMLSFQIGNTGKDNLAESYQMIRVFVQWLPDALTLTKFIHRRKISVISTQEVIQSANAYDDWVHISYQQTPM